ncbi:unnamed protein product [Allacma fusca]|uniref:Uncharacterized protein n=1 Tax=Allacma fusca TaxID=39272 RepID=A0A8J2KA94_9HEXA|nr:unnamed protein product [Allacma fusca]
MDTKGKSTGVAFIQIPVDSDSRGSDGAPMITPTQQEQANSRKGFFGRLCSRKEREREVSSPSHKTGGRRFNSRWEEHMHDFDRLNQECEWGGVQLLATLFMIIVVLFFIFYRLFVEPKFDNVRIPDPKP